MKNIHVLPTDKPSRVYNVLGSKRLGFTSNDPFFTENTGGGTQNQHIYITNSEEIKVGDWCFDINGKIFKHENHFPISIGQRKIILTTDQDLIKDGVQAIHDEFLEWFVKNTGCDFVEVESFIRYNPIVYQIILPKPKQETLEEEFSKKLKSKQLEFSSNLNPLDMFNLGAEWQSERMYQSMKECWYAACAYSIGSHKEFKQTHPNFKEWFEQFKKKRN